MYRPKKYVHYLDRDQDSCDTEACPLSPLLFNLVVEAMAIAVRADKGMQGIQIYENRHKIVMYVDDTGFFFFRTLFNLMIHNSLY